ncbi:MAG: RsmB/NOP family class I SAM-dependent RNA methyltransferase, partial [Candidatus Omnitrophica bacterium]|nr:RsmB/NOP family class I SAM-dependent RNA methyltransferase [Candidatus Omnitrophota bacterium]
FRDVEVVGAIHELPLHSIYNRTQGLSQWEGKKFHPSLKKAVRILPAFEMEGFFVAKLRKR